MVSLGCHPPARQPLGSCRHSSHPPGACQQQQQEQELTACFWSTDITITTTTQHLLLLLLLLLLPLPLPLLLLLLQFSLQPCAVACDVSTTVQTSS